MRKYLLLIAIILFSTGTQLHAQMTDSAQMSRSQKRIDNATKNANRDQRRAQKHQKKMDRQEHKMKKAERRKNKNVKTINKEQEKMSGSN